MSRGMVAHDVVPPLNIHLGHGEISDPGLTRDHFANVNDYTSRGAAHSAHFDFPGFVSAAAPLRAYITGVIHLTAGLDVKASLGENHLNLIAERYRLNRLSVGNQRQNFALDVRAGIWIVFH